MAEVTIMVERMRNTENGERRVGFRATAEYNGCIIERTATCPEIHVALVGESELIKLAKGRVLHEIKIINSKIPPRYEC